ncbi:MAG: leucine--tRNA ligase [Solitalea-like symbiont of Acarus siro]
MIYRFQEIEDKWRKFWEEKSIFEVDIDPNKPKYYILSMFPYPSGAGLHVGHPLGYIAADILARYKRLQGFCVLHPMGFDAFGLPAEQYAIQTGLHPEITTKKNINKYKEQLKLLGLSYSWDREISTSGPEYYKWTQWIFIKLFNSWYNKHTKKAEPIDSLIKHLDQYGTDKLHAFTNTDTTILSAKEWSSLTASQKETELLKYRLAYKGETTVNWCPELKTVLANDEVKNGLSERGGHPVVTKKMTQWLLGITAYADRLLSGLDSLSWPDSIKEIQRNWIGKSQGVTLQFKVHEKQQISIEVFTTRVDTLFGASFIAIAPEHPLVNIITTDAQKSIIETYINNVSKKSEIERMSETDTASGVFTGAYAQIPFSNRKIPIWIADYVIVTYGTGAVMGVPSGDERDYKIAKNFDLPIINILDSQNTNDNADNTKDGKYINSEFINGLTYNEAIKVLVDKLEQEEIGSKTINYKIRDAIFTRQRYWGEPIPIYYNGGIPKSLPKNDLPLFLPDIDNYKPTDEGLAPLARLDNWKYLNKYNYETGTMPGWAGSSWYWYRYMDPKNNLEFASKETINYWQNVDFYLGGAEHATGHLIYARFWNQFLYDLGLVPKEEPFKKLLNQGMIQGRSNFIYRIIGENTYVSYGLKDNYTTQKLHVDINCTNNDILDIKKLQSCYEQYSKAKFILENGNYICGYEIEKMSKSKLNILNPDSLIYQYGADTLRLYEMFLGPIEQSKPWNTQGITGAQNFLKKFYKLLFTNDKFYTSAEKANNNELYVIQTLIKKVKDYINRYSFNTIVSAFMICINSLKDLKCIKKEILEPLVILLSPYAPFICEEFWSLLGNKEGSISYAGFPQLNEQYLTTTSFNYPVSINGKVKFKLEIPLDYNKDQIEALILDNEKIRDIQITKIIIIPIKIINIVYIKFYYIVINLYFIQITLYYIKQEALNIY